MARLLLENAIEHFAPYSTLFRKWWIAIMFVFRIIVVVSIGDTVYSDEQTEFVCNTKQPGCKQVCYNLFAPISHIRFWAFQIIATATPSVLFITYAMHKSAIIPNKENNNNLSKDAETQTIWRRASVLNKRWKKGHTELISGFKKSQSFNQHSLICSDVTLKDNRASCASPQNAKVCKEKIIQNIKNLILKAYIITLVISTLIEAACTYAQYYLFDWSVKEIFECTHNSCPNTVQCYVSRSMEKTFFLYFMFGVGIICILINLFELHYLGVLKIKQSCKKMAISVKQDQLLGTVDEYYPSNGLSRGRVIIHGTTVPHGYYIPYVDPPDIPYKSLSKVSFTTSERDVTSDGEASSVWTINHARSKNSRLYV